MRVLVTGGAGFIGSHIIDVLMADGHDCVAVDNLSTGLRANVPPGARLIEADLRDQSALARVFAEVKPQWVCHQAAQMSVSRSVREPQYDAEVNIMGTLHVLQQAQEHGVERLVFASSGGVLYGDVTEPAPESTPANPISPYGIAKLVGELYLQFYCREHGMTAVALRYANVYGPRQNPHGEAGVVAIFCQKMLAGERARINGDGRYVRDYVYCTDVAAANRAAFVAPLSGFAAFNVGTGVPTDVNVLADVLLNRCQEWLTERKRSGTIPPPEHGPARPGDLRSNLVSYARIAQQLGWAPQVDLNEGLSRTVAWFGESA
jgi:UDP-glucose 4-epimerase